MCCHLVLYSERLSACCRSVLLYSLYSLSLWQSMTSLCSAGLLAHECTTLNPLQPELDQPMICFVPPAHALQPSGQTSKSKSGYLRRNGWSLCVKRELCSFKILASVRINLLLVQVQCILVLHGKCKTQLF